MSGDILARKVSIKKGDVHGSLQKEEEDTIIHLDMSNSDEDGEGEEDEGEQVNEEEVWHSQIVGSLTQGDLEAFDSDDEIYDIDDCTEEIMEGEDQEECNAAAILIEEIDCSQSMKDDHASSSNNAISINNKKKQSTSKQQISLMKDDQSINHKMKQSTSKQQISLTQINFVSKTPTSKPNLKRNNAELMSVSTTNGSQKKRKSRPCHKQYSPNNQVTLTQLQHDTISKQLFVGNNKSTSHHYKDTKDKIFYKKGLNMMGIWKRDEKVSIKQKGYEESILIIDKFERRGKKRKIQVIGKLYQKLSKTYVRGISKDDKFQSFITKLNLVENQYILYEEKQSFPLECIGEQIHNFTPPSDPIKYSNINGTKGSFGQPGHGYRIRYLNCKHAKKKPTDKYDNFDSSFILHASDALDALMQNSENASNNRNPKENPKEKIKLLDIFAGVGGMSQGFFLAGGFDLKWAVESDHIAAATFERNHQGTFVFKECFLEFTEKLEKLFKKSDKKVNESNPYVRLVKTVQHIHFSPPCQAFSKINRGGKNDEKNAYLTLACITFIKFILQHSDSFKSITMENVVSIMENGKDNYLKTFVMSLIDFGMDVEIDILDSSRYGDPQKRQRMFIQAKLPHSMQMEFPVETHSPNESVTVGEALRDLVNIEPQKGNGLVDIIKHGVSVCVQNHCIKGTDLKAETEKLDSEKPAHTVRGMNILEHPNGKRMTTIRERARLQSFPDSFVFSGNMTQQTRGIGNAVPVQTATAIAKSVKQLYND